MSLSFEAWQDSKSLENDGDVVLHVSTSWTHGTAHKYADKLRLRMGDSNLILHELIPTKLIESE